MCYINKSSLALPLLKCLIENKMKIFRANISSLKISLLTGLYFFHTVSCLLVLHLDPDEQ